MKVPACNLIGAALAGAFCAAFAGPCAYSATIDMGGRHVTMVFSLMNMAGNLGAVAFPILVPYLLNEDPDVAGSGNWDLVLFTFAVSRLKIPPPLELAVFPVIVLLVTFTFAVAPPKPELKIPPPRDLGYISMVSVVLPLIVQLSIVGDADSQ